MGKGAGVSMFANSARILLRRSECEANAEMCCVPCLLGLHFIDVDCAVAAVVIRLARN